MPSVTQYDQLMLRGPRAVPVISRLGGGSLAMAGGESLWRVVGGDAVVYQLRQPNGHLVALRCPLAEIVPADVAERYAALGQGGALKRLSEVENAPFVASLSYHANGIVETSDDLRSMPRPIMAMDWVMGPTLMAAADRAARAREGDRLRTLADSWRIACLAAGSAGFAHGDLRPENAIVRNRAEVVFVDYDTAFWPTAPSVSSIAPHPAYRHPKGPPRNPARRDDFAAFLIYTSLRVLAVWPELRDELGDAGMGRDGALLFTPRDLASPDGSALFGRIRVVDDPIVQGLAGILRESCRTAPDNIPPFVDALTMVEHVARQAPARRPVPQPPTPTPRPSRVSTLIDEPAPFERTRPRRQADGARLHAELPSWAAPKPHARPDQLARLREALDRRDVAAAEAAWADVRGLAEGAALAAEVDALRSEVIRRRAGDALAARDDIALLDATRDAGRAGVSMAIDVRRESRAAAHRRGAAQRLDDALRGEDHETLIDLALSGDLDEGPPLDDATTRKVVVALAIGHIERALRTDDDGLIAEAVAGSIFESGDGLSLPQRERIGLARERVSWRTDLRAALRAHDAQMLRRLVNDAPPGAVAMLSASERRRVQRQLDQHEAMDRLARAVEQQNDTEIVDAFRSIEELGAPITDGFPWESIRNVIDRYSLIAAVRRAASSKPRDYERLARLLPQLRLATGDQVPYLGTDISFEELESEVRRQAQVARIREALQSDNDRTIVTAALPDLFGAIPLLARSEQARIERASAAVNRALRRSSKVTGSSQTPSAFASSEGDSTTASGASASTSS